jgi:hypothetical protein
MTPSGGGSKNLLKIQLQYQGMNVYNILTMYEVYSLAYISKWRGKQIVSRRNDQMIYIMSLQKKSTMNINVYQHSGIITWKKQADSFPFFTFKQQQSVTYVGF